ncbi:helix-turn-helix domain-containing protein [Nonomuraea typhae]|uniref:helix-turn-helix domain-containing protein n=1 Tax=Nonomuraea typhae TaxID=2603600 RepID=UPI0015E1E379|nr:helix-turn-helix transcriptional regulator [Nonomuraea typhae]
MTHQPEQRNPSPEDGPVKQSRPGLIRARLQRGLTQEQAAGQIGVSLSTWARWERGTQNVRPFYRKVLAEQWDAKSGEVDAWFQVTACSSLTPCADVAIDDAGLAEPMFQASSVETARQLWRLEMDTSRRHLLAALPFMPSLLSEWLVSWAYDAPTTTGSGGVRTEHKQTVRQVGAADVARVREARQAFSQMDHQFGAGLVRPAVTDFLDSQLSAMLAGTYRNDTRGELLSAASSMTQLAGWMAYDLGHHGQAQRHYGQALNLAKAADDQLIAAYVLAALAQQACDLGHGRWALRLATAARDAGRQAGAPPRVEALLMLRQARAEAVTAQTADQRGAHARRQVGLLLSQAERHFSQGPNDRDPFWSASFGQAELAAEAGYCWQCVGEHRKAADLAEQALAGFGTSYARSTQFNRVHAAHAYLDLGDLDHALALATPAIPAAKELTSARAVAHIRDFADRLTPHTRVTDVQDFNDMLHDSLAS